MIRAPLDALEIKGVYWAYKKIRIPGTQWDICGYSRSAYRTGFYVSQLDMLLDAGPQHFARPSRIFITHTHGDHIANLPFTLIPSGGEALPVSVYVPTVAVSHIERYIDTLFTTNGLYEQPPREEINNYYQCYGFDGGEVMSFNVARDRIYVHTYTCEHRIPTIGYGFSVEKQKLLPQYQGLSGEEIKTLRLSGQQVTRPVTECKFAYICDTTINVFNFEKYPENSALFRFPVIFIECTFLREGDTDGEDKSHIYWNQLEPYVHKNRQITFVLFHFSQRYKDLEIREFFQSGPGVDNPNVIPWISDL